MIHGESRPRILSISFHNLRTEDSVQVSLILGVAISELKELRVRIRIDGEYEFDSSVDNNNNRAC